MSAAEIVSLFLVIICSVLADILDDYDEETRQLKKTLHATLLEELHGAHLRIAATNVSPKLVF